MSPANPFHLPQLLALSPVAPPPRMLLALRAYKVLL